KFCLRLTTMEYSCLGESEHRISALTDETVDKANILEEMAVDVPSDAHTEDIHSDVVRKQIHFLSPCSASGLMDFLLSKLRHRCRMKHGAKSPF
ncbi:hypothetical protein KIN20_014568, partial [Parelaphostrongylus tenuis]